MFSAIRNFLGRHRRKFYIGGGIIGGVVLLSKFAEYKLWKWHEEQTKSLRDRQCRRTHYEKTRQTANATALNLSSNIIKIVTEELQVDEILQALRNKPANKLKLWEELKIEGFSRAVAAIYTSALIGSVVNAKLMLLASYSYESSVKNDKSQPKVTPEIQEKYLANLQTFIENGLPDIIAKIRTATECRVRSIQLNENLSLDQLEGVLKDITLLLNGDSSFFVDKEENNTFKLQPWSRYIVDHSLSMERSCTSEELVFHRMRDSLIDVVDGNDFGLIVQQLVNHGLNFILDYVAESYPQPSHFPVQPIVRLSQKESLSTGLGFDRNSEKGGSLQLEVKSIASTCSGLTNEKEAINDTKALNGKDQANRIESDEKEVSTCNGKDEIKDEKSLNGKEHSDNVEPKSKSTPQAPDDKSVTNSEKDKVSDMSSITGTKPKTTNVAEVERLQSKTNVSNGFHSMISGGCVIKTSLPLAKLVPIMTNLVQPTLSASPGYLLQSILLDERLENMAFNIYEAFSRN